ASLGKRPGKASCYTGFIDQAVISSGEVVTKEASAEIGKEKECSKRRGYMNEQRRKVAYDSVYVLG
nr:hypothetical protein [Tanacetum cinerariifolium]